MNIVCHRFNSIENSAFQDPMEPTPQQVALFVPPIDGSFNPDRVPQTAEEYLQQVIYERTVRVPEVASNHRNKPKAKPSPTWDKLNEANLKNSAPEDVMPTKEWTEVQLDLFQKLQEKIQRLKEDESHQMRGLSSEVINDWKAFCKENPPLLKTVLSLSQSQWEALLEEQTEWLAQEKEFKLHSDHFWMGQWIYACLANLMIPIEPNVHHLIREIARMCIKRRNELTCTQEVSPLSILICIVSIHFKQSDLCV